MKPNRPKFYLLVSLLALLYVTGFIFISCEGQLPELELVRFSGVVTDAFTSEPLQGATVIIPDYDSLSARSSVSGAFEFSRLKLDDGTFELLVINEDYVDAKGFVTIKEGQQEDTLSIAMTPKEGLEFDRTLVDLGASLDSLVISVTNVSSQDLDVSLSPSSPWVTTNTNTFSIVSGASVQLTLKASRENLAVGVHEATVSFAVVGRPTQSLPIQCQILDPESARLAISATSLDFGKATAAQNIKVSNEGESTLTWTASASAGWIAIDPKSGTVGSDQEQSITVMIDRQSLTEEGLYSGEVSFSSNGGTSILTISVEVDKSIGILEIDPVGLDFGKTLSSEMVTLTNGGTAALMWSVESTVPWIVSDFGSVSKTLEPSSSKNITVKIDRGDLERGTYNGSLVFTVSGQEIELPIAMEVATGELILSTDSIGFGLDETSFTLGLQNQGNATISWTSSDTEDWISRDKSSGGLAAGASTSINITVSRVGKEKGDYSGTVSITVGEDVFNIPVTMQSPGGVLSLSEEQLDFGSDDSSLSVVLSNTGTVSLDYSLSTDDSWISFSRSSGSIARGSTSSLSISVDRSGFDQGDYQGLVAFSANASTINLPVSLSASGGVLELDADQLDFDYDQSSLSIKLTNTGTSTVSWEASSSAAWLSLNTTEGNLAQSSSITIDAAVHRDGLSQGNYTSAITFLNGEQTIEVPVSMVVEGGVLTYTPSSLDFGGVETNLFFKLINTGLGSLNWTATEGVDWIIVSPAMGTVGAGAEATLSVSVDRVGLDIGTYSSQISLDGDGGTGTISVQMQVEQDTDNDGIPDNIDADNDNDGLIDIYTINDLYDMRYDLTASGTNLQGGPASGFIGYELMNDLDFSSDADYDDLSLKAEVTTGSGWLPIGTSSSSTRFNTIFDGNDYTISDLLINRTTDYNGLFGHTNNLAFIRNVSVEIKFLSGGHRTAGLIGRNYQGKVFNCDVSGSLVGLDDSGLLIGEDLNGTVQNCSSSGSVTGRNAVGGLIGDFDNSGVTELRYSYSSAVVRGEELVGGLVGTTSNNSIISQCYATGNITSTDQYSGGLLGYLHSGATLTSCYATGNINSSSRYVGGLVGWVSGSISSCYATGAPVGTSAVGGLVGNWSSGSITNTNYWDTQVSGMTTSDGGLGLTTTELQGQTSASGIYITWSSDDWDFGTSTQYPALKNMPGGLDIQRQ